LPGAQMLFVPLVASRGVVGVLGMRPAAPDLFEDPDQRHLLETFANQIALAVERGLLADEAQSAQVGIESERLRNTLLSSVSHDLRTPLAAITGGTSALLDHTTPLDEPARREVLLTMREEADRLNRLVQNLLEMTRLEAGMQVRKEWHPIEEPIGAALAHFGARLKGRTVTTTIPPDLPLVPLDPVLIERVVANLVDNALKYTPPGSPIEISAGREGDGIVVEIVDRGPGLPSGDEGKVFDKFYRGIRSVTGSGLGLAICRGLVEAHGGRIDAVNRPGGGAIFRFTLPVKESPPALDPVDG
jgi:two-component system, OmpR family, sensor histidine kinase KdpD